MPVQGVQGSFCHPGYPYAGVGGAHCGYGGGCGFALIVVLFILLIIIGACCTHIW
ncbi:YjcZ family sporulation protein [Bacillus sp. JJ1609]|uniref:YjcZ family sporulation protein n=1 Tax=Bacillus sp. JJ1609 TaxID=3122977 RepID=UPI0030000C34